jgi:hypothetical protein
MRFITVTTKRILGGARYQLLTGYLSKALIYNRGNEGRSITFKGCESARLVRFVESVPGKICLLHSEVNEKI